MQSTVVTIRLNADELGMLDAISGSRTRGDVTRSELIRLLIHREFHRRTEGTSKIPVRDWAREFRNGRPRKQQPGSMWERIKFQDQLKEAATAETLKPI